VAIILPSRFTSQPQYAPQIDRAGIGAGLIGFLWIGPNGPRELVAAPWNILETGIARQPRNKGIAAVSAGGTNDFIGSARLGAPAWIPTALPITYLAFFDHTTPGSTSSLAGYTAGLTGYQLMDGYGTRSRIAKIQINGVNYLRDPGTTWNVGASVRGLTVNATNLIGYDNGVSFGSTATAAGAITYDATYSRKLLLGFGSDGLGIAGHGYWEALWNRVLTPGEIAQLSANPWMLFKAPQRRIWVPSAGAAPILTGTLGQFDPELRIDAWF
jgi:hypothetical protein